MKYCWVFINKGDGFIKSIFLYGSVRQMCNEQKVSIGKTVKTEQSLRYMLKQSNDRYEDVNYRIEKVELKRSKKK